MKRCRLLIKGQVQGVGFRPTVYRIAEQLKLTGWVQNTSSGVLVEIQGEDTASFINLVYANLPSLAHIDSVEISDMQIIEDEQHFTILQSESGAVETLISPDTAICSECLKDLFDPDSHYYHFPFINCTQCGPRFTITHSLPYDRCNTSMDDFRLCPDCLTEYNDPANRRYHAQPTACARCGPRLSSDIQSIARALNHGEIVALKGKGGYQLICDARNEKTVLKLRERKQREAKPLALMVLNVASAEPFVHMGSEEEQLLENSARPIILLKKGREELSDIIADGLCEFGVMLPSTPLHYLIFHALAGYPDGCEWLKNQHNTVLVVTSANISGNPLLTDDEKARRELSGIADLIVSYNRSIVTRADDSVLRVVAGAPMFIRRARGYCPQPIQLPHAIPSVLALGANLKNTFCITRGNQAFVSQYLGSLHNRETIEFFHESLEHWQRFLGVNIEAIACDLHPDFYTSRLAEQYGLPLMRVQHHHAHLAAVAAEHHYTKPVIGLALDGYGYGNDGDAWGGELMLLENETFEHLGSFAPLPLPGGDYAAREPWRMGAAVLHCLGKTKDIPHYFAQQEQAEPIMKMLHNNFTFPQTTSCGRWFDAASALSGLCLRSNYEGQAAMLLESLVTVPEIINNSWSFDEQYFNPLPIFEYLLSTSASRSANLFHGSLIAGLAEWLVYWSKKTGIRTVLLNGGCFLNKVLTEGLFDRLNQQGVSVYIPRRLPPNDSGLSLGQAWILGSHYVLSGSCSNYQSA